MAAVDGVPAGIDHPNECLRPARPVEGKRTGVYGPEAWSLTGVTAGHAGCAVLAGVDLAGRRGEGVALSGPNGGGKTTPPGGLAGLPPPPAGAVERRARRLAALAQKPPPL